MAGQYGTIFTTPDLKRQLLEANRDYRGRKTWENLYSSIDFATKQQANELSRNYAAAVSEAYSNAYQTNKAIANSNLGEGYKESAITDTDIALQQAYDTYRSNYLQGLGELESAAATAQSEVTDKLTEQAEYTKRFADAPYEYLQYLFNQYSEGAQDKNIFYTNELWKRYTTEETDEQGNSTGNRILKPWEDIVNYGAYEEYTDEQGNIVKDWTGLFDESGNLTIKGADFYDQMMNAFATTGNGLSFGQWLANTDEELYDWSQSYNPYDFTTEGTNKGSFKTMVGLTSTDEQYSFIERYGGMSKSEIDNMYSTFTNKMSELNDKLADASGRYTKDITTEFHGLTNEISKLTEQLGIKEDIEEQMGMDFDSLAEYMSELANNSVSNGDIWWEGIKAAFGGGAMGTGGAASAVKTGMKFGAASAAKSAGTALGATAAKASTAIPVVGWIVAAIIGVANATAAGISESERLKKQNLELANASKEAYNELVTNLVAYSHSQRRQKQSDFYRR